MRVFKDPLWLFLLAGGAMFLLAETFAEDEIPYTINVTAADVSRLSDQWAMQMRRPPTQVELEGLIEQHIKEEIYYREAQRLQLDKNDTIVRRRLVQKLTFLTEDIALAEPLDDEGLRKFFAEHQTDYQVPTRYSFSHRYFSTDRRENAAADAKAALTDQNLTDDAFMLRKSYALRSHRDIADLFGTQFATQLKALTPSEAWQGPIQSAYGWHPVRLLAVEDAYIPDFESVRDRVEIDAQQAARRAADDAHFQKLKEKYEINTAAHSEQAVAGAKARD